ncbi:hypothetical protein F2Q70_00013753 [Brassica cretica]|uniref:Uncharacterized protein n=1 Tax=Brassica cretica TaxID=69181 RepID=A0A8S9M6M0_BRACR|nr:hypothetical protein F2Q70_00013753 [Brassica cretica]
MKAWSARVTLTSKRLQTGDFGIIFISTTHRRSCGSGVVAPKILPNMELCFECHLLYSNQYATITPQTMESLCTPKVPLRECCWVVYLNYHHCETSHEVDRRGAENTTGCLEATIDEGSTMDSTPLPCQTETVVSIDSKASGSGVTRKQRQCSKSIS